MGLSQKELAAMLGVTNKAISKWETNSAFPKAELLIKLAEIFNVSADELLDLSKNSKDHKPNKIRTLEELSKYTDTLLEEQSKEKPSYEFSIGTAWAYLISVGIIITGMLIFLSISIPLAFIEMTDLELTVYPLIVLVTFGTYAITAFYTGVFCFIVYYKCFPTPLKVTSVALLFITVIIIFYGGMIILIPAVIKSIKIIKNFKKGDTYEQR